MAKYLKLFMVALFTTMSFALTSCGDDEDDDVSFGNRGTISINNVKYDIDKYMTYDGKWDSYSEEGSFGFFIDIKEGKTITPWPYTFDFESENVPKVGDDLSKMDLTMSLLSDYYTELTLIETEYVSGSAVIKNINKTDETITIQFSNLKMKGYGYRDGYNKEAVNYLLDGTIIADFRI